MLSYSGQEGLGCRKEQREISDSIEKLEGHAMNGRGGERGRSYWA